MPQLVNAIYDAYSPDPDAAMTIEQFAERFTANDQLREFFGEHAELIFSRMREGIAAQKAQMVGEKPVARRHPDDAIPRIRRRRPRSWMRSMRAASGTLPARPI